MLLQMTMMKIMKMRQWKIKVIFLKKFNFKKKKSQWCFWGLLGDLSFDAERAMCDLCFEFDAFCEEL